MSSRRFLRYLSALCLLISCLAFSLNSSLIADDRVPNEPLTYEVHRVILLRIDGTITEIIAGYVEEGIRSAGKGDLIVILLNTPGGLISSTRRIVKAILNSKVPIVTFIYPKGAHAASAGSFIALASDLIYMAPGTCIGAAHPVTLPITPSGDDKGTSKILMEKVTEDLRAWGRALAKMHNRDSKLVEKMIEESLSLSPDEAVGKIVDGIAEDLDKLLEDLNNREIWRRKLKIRLHSTPVSILEYKLSPTMKILQKLSEPQLAYILVTIGMYLIVLEVFHYTGGIAISIGAILLLLGLTGLGLLSFNVFGFLLMVGGLILSLMELKFHTGGWLIGLGGTLLVLGSALLFTHSNLLVTPPWKVIESLSLAIITVLVGIIFTVKRSLGSQGDRLELKGSICQVRALKPLTVECQGILWEAISTKELREGQKVKVIAREGLKLIVEPLEGPPQKE